MEEVVVMDNEKTVAERLREKPEERSLECYLAKSLIGIECSSCKSCYDKCTNALADMIEAEEAKIAVDAMREAVEERTKTEHDGVDVDALLKLADEIEPKDWLATEESDYKKWADAIRNAVKGAIFEQAKPQLPEGVEWPRFEDGQPVKFGDEFIEKHGSCAVTVDQILFEDDMVGLKEHWEDPIWHQYGAPFKRPEPEVLDADGVKINVGDTVYVVGGAVPEEVREIRLREGCGIYEVMTEYMDDADMGYLPEKLTHQAPVLDADGVKIDVGDTVWCKHDNAEIVVTGFEDGFVKVLDETPNSGVWIRLAPEHLTHRKPDSHGDIEDDATLPPREYCDRYQLLGADSAYFDESEAVEAMCKHLIHRTRKLLGGE